MDRHAGFVLAGGRSSRMGRDKALIEFEGTSLLRRACDTVAAAAGSATVIGGASRYQTLGFEVVDEDTPGSGPLGGIVKALSLHRARWNLIVACDMPHLTPAFLSSLLRTTDTLAGDCLLPVDSAGLAQPLCAVYRDSCLVPFRQALASGVRKLLAAIDTVSVSRLQVLEDQHFANLNVPADCEILHP